MLRQPFTAPLALCASLAACGQTNSPMEKNHVPMQCDTLTGACTVPSLSGHEPGQAPILSDASKPITLIYFTDPICSSCWGAEPQLRRLMLEYGSAIAIETHMGGLLPSWEVYDSGGISKPSDVAAHWDEVSPRYRMPIIGDVWLTDPLPSSYPPSIAYKAAALQDPEAATVFLRRLREMVFVEKQNIARWPAITEAALFAGLDSARLRIDSEGAAQALFQADLTLARSLGVLGFPSFIFSNASGERRLVYGARPYADFVAAIAALAPEVKPGALPTDLHDLLLVHESWCAEEVAVALGVSHADAREMLIAAEQEGLRTAVHSRNGNVWRRR